MAGAPPNGWIPPQPSSVQPAGLVWLDHGASATWRARSQPRHYAKPRAPGAVPNGWRPTRTREERPLRSAIPVQPSVPVMWSAEWAPVTAALVTFTVAGVLL